jgi:hypothetical protein
MQKTLFVALPMAALAAAILVVAVVLRKERAESPAPDSNSKTASSRGRILTPEESARLLKENERLAEENRKLRQEKEALAGKASGEPESEAVTDFEKALRKANWKTRKDAHLAAKVKSMPWKKNVQGVIAYWKEIEAAREEGRPPEYSKELLEPLQLLQKDMVELAEILGTSADGEVFRNELVGSAWMDAFFQEITGGSITEAQLASLRETTLYSAEPQELPNRLENWKMYIERNRAFGTETSGILTAEQQALVSSTVSPTYLLSVSAAYGEKTFTGMAPETASGVASYWIKTFKLAEDQRAAVEAVAADYVRYQAEIAQAVAAQYGSVTTRDAQYDLLIKSLEAQIAAEKKLAETLHLTSEQAQKLLKGSGVVLKIAQ